jgi:hypothetical protein
MNSDLPAEILKLIFEYIPVNKYYKEDYLYHDQMIDYIKNKDNIKYMFNFNPTIKQVLLFTNQDMQATQGIIYAIPPIYH